MLRKKDHSCGRRNDGKKEDNMNTSFIVDFLRDETPIKRETGVNKIKLQQLTKF